MTSVYPDFKMEVGSGGQTGTPRFGDDLALFHMLARRRHHLGIMGVKGGQSAAVVYDNHIPVDTAMPPGKQYHTVPGRYYIGTRGTPDIDSRMEAPMI